MNADFPGYSTQHLFSLSSSSLRQLEIRLSSAASAIHSLFVDEYRVGLQKRREGVTMSLLSTFVSQWTQMRINNVKMGRAAVVSRYEFLFSSFFFAVILASFLCSRVRIVSGPLSYQFSLLVTGCMPWASRFTHAKSTWQSSHPMITADLQSCIK